MTQEERRKYDDWYKLVESRAMRGKANSFGTMLRASRLGFFYVPQFLNYVRISWLDEEKGLLEVEICPPQIIHNPKMISNLDKRKKVRKNVEYIVWTDHEETANVVISTLASKIGEVDDYQTFKFNSEGELVQ